MQEDKTSIDTHDLQYDIYLQRLLAGDKNFCLHYCRTYVASGASLIDLYINIIKRALYDIGELWQKNIISVTSEGLATAISEAIINSFYADILPVQKLNRSVIVASLERENHKIGTRMVADVFELNAWETHLYTNTVTYKILMEFIAVHKPDIVALSITYEANLIQLDKAIIEINSKYPNIHIIVGGRAFVNYGEEIIAKYQNTIYIKELDELDNFIKSFDSN